MSNAKRQGHHGFWSRVRNGGIACCITYALASIAHSQYVVAKTEAMGVTVPLADRLRMTGGDLIGLQAYAIVIALGLLIAWSVLGGFGRWLHLPRLLVYPLGGLLAMGAIMGAMAALFPMTLLAPAREWSGALWQCLAGVAGGVVFALLETATAGNARSKAQASRTQPRSTASS